MCCPPWKTAIRTYYENETVRKATLHAVGDLYGKIGTGVLNAFADKLTGFDLVNGAFGAERGSNLYLTLDARYNYEAYRLWAAAPGRWRCITTRPARSCAWCRHPAMTR